MLAHRLQDVHGGGRRVQPHAVGQARIVVGVIGEDEGDALVCVRFLAQRAPAARQLGHEADAFGLRLVAHHVHLGAVAAPSQPLEADGSCSDAAVDLGQHHLHGQVAWGQSVRIGLPLFFRATGGNQLQHRVEHHAHAVLGGHGLQRGQADRVLQ